MNTFHAYGFHHGRPSDLTVTIVSGTVAEVANGITDGISAHGHEVINKTTTRSLDGCLDAVEFDVQTAPDMTMWHRIGRTSTPWRTRVLPPGGSDV